MEAAGEGLVLAHWLGLIGESLNFFGAVILALDIFLRKRGEEELRKLEDLSVYARKFNSPATYKGFAVADPHFARDVTHWNAKKLAYAGTILLALGFALLIAYHVVEMKAIADATSSEIRNPNIQKGNDLTHEPCPGASNSSRPD